MFLVDLVMGVSFLIIFVIGAHLLPTVLFDLVCFLDGCPSSSKLMLEECPNTESRNRSLLNAAWVGHKRLYPRSYVIEASRMVTLENSRRIRRRRQTVQLQTDRCFTRAVSYLTVATYSAEFDRILTLQSGGFQTGRPFYFHLCPTGARKSTLQIIFLGHEYQIRRERCRLRPQMLTREIVAIVAPTVARSMRPFSRTWPPIMGAKCSR